MNLLTTLLGNKYFKFIFSLFVILTFMFGRSFMGIYIFEYRIGELTMGFAFLFLMYSFLNFKKVYLANNMSKEFVLVLFFIFCFFIINSFISKSNFLDTYTFKSSSYVWSLGMFSFGILFFKINPLNKNFLKINYFILIFIYYYGVFGPPQYFQDFVLEISDKFEPHKGSDILIIFAVIFYLNNKFFQNKRIVLEIFTIYSAIFAPLLLFKSRGAFIAFIFFITIEFFKLLKYFKSSLKRNLALTLATCILFIQSVTIINGSLFIEISQTEENVKNIVEYRADPDDEKFRLLFIEEDYWTKEMRIKSTDNNLNWRLQIWQDVYFDLNYKNMILTGYGYKNKIPAMEIITRQGLDRKNENVHNFFVNLYARGGLVHLMLFALLYFYIIRDIYRATNEKYYLPLMITVFFTAFFDVAMENAHFPLIFYFVLGMSIHKKRIFAN